MGAGQDVVSRSLVQRQTLAGQRADVHRRAAVADHAVNRNPAARLHDDGIADLQFGGQHALFLAVTQPPTAARKDLDQRAQRPLGALEGDAFETFAEHADEDNFRGNKWFFQEDGGDAGEGQGEVGTDAAGEESVERTVEGAHRQGRRL